jgi:hypothetical protein
MAPIGIEDQKHEFAIREDIIDLGTQWIVGILSFWIRFNGTTTFIRARSARKNQ